MASWDEELNGEELNDEELNDEELNDDQLATVISKSTPPRVLSACKRGIVSQNLKHIARRNGLYPIRTLQHD